jgi:hypothetical protein
MVKEDYVVIQILSTKPELISDQHLLAKYKTSPNHTLEYLEVGSCKMIESNQAQQVKDQHFACLFLQN